MFEGLRLQGRRIDDGLDTENLDKFRNDKKVDEHVYLQNKTGNVYINNNINLFISNSR